MVEKNYNIHNIITFKIKLNSANPIHRLFFRYLDIEYKNFESSSINNPDFVVYLGDFTPSIQDCYILDDLFYIKNDYLYSQDSYKFAKWKFEISGLEKDTTLIRISNNFIAYMFLSGAIIDFVIHYKANRKGFPIVHASCVAKNKCGFLFTARGGGGKTTIALNLIERGFKYLGDNFIILHNGYALSFLSPLSIFTYNLAPIARKLKKIDKFILFLKNILYRLTFGYVKIFTRVNVMDVFPDNIIDSVKLKSIFLLLPGTDFYIEEIKKQDLINHIVLNQKLEFSFFDRYISAYSYVFPNSKLANHWKEYRDNLDRNIDENILIYKIEVPQSYSADIINSILKVITNEANSEL